MEIQELSDAGIRAHGVTVAIYAFGSFSSQIQRPTRFPHLSLFLYLVHFCNTWAGGARGKELLGPLLLGWRAIR